MTFRDLVDDVVKGTAAWNPAWASANGLREFDRRLADRSADAYARRATDVRAWLERLKATEDGDPVDREALRFALDLESFHLVSVRQHERNPDFAGELMDHVLPLLIRRGEEPAHRLGAIAERLAGAGEFLERARTRLRPVDVPPLWVQVARETADHAPAFLEAVDAAAADAPPTQRGAVHDAVPVAKAALAAHAEWLDHELSPVAKGEWALGQELFGELLRRRGFREDVHDLWRLGEEAVERFRGEAREAAVTVLAAAGKTPAAEPVREAWRVVTEDHPPTFMQVLAEYRDAIAEAERFVRERGLATVPDTPLDVVETPAYLRHLIPFAAYIQPPRFLAGARGTYLVTPKMDLSAFARADVRNTTVHEAYPGHHLQMSVERASAGTARFLVGESAPEMFEGWALYCEEIMGVHGFTSSPADRFVRARDALWRAVRILLDVGLHTGRVSFDEAVSKLARETAMSTEEAAAEVKRYTLSPTYNLSYMYGRLAFDRARKDAVASGRMTEREFHDRVLRAGSLPLSLLLPLVIAPVSSR